MFYFCIAIGLWCNGNTTDSGPVILGSNPGSPTKERGCVLHPLSLVVYVTHPLNPPPVRGTLDSVVQKNNEVYVTHH